MRRTTTRTGTRKKRPYKRLDTPLAKWREREGISVEEMQQRLNAIVAVDPRAALVPKRTLHYYLRGNMPELPVRRAALATLTNMAPAQLWPEVARG